MAEYEFKYAGGDTYPGGDIEETQDPMECDCCGYPAPLKTFRFFDSSNRTLFNDYCEVCSATYLSQIERSIGSESISSRLAKSIGYIANMILDEIRKSR